MSQSVDTNICVIIENNLFKIQYVLETILLNTPVGMNYQLYIYSNEYLDDSVNEYLNNLIDKIKEKKINANIVFKQFIKKLNNAEIYNSFLRESVDGYFCIINTNTLVPIDYILDLKYNYTNIMDSGIAMIKCDNNGKKLRPYLCKDDSLKMLWDAESMIINDKSIIYFNNELVKKIGYFDEGLNDNLIIDDYLYRSLSTTNQNYYLQNLTAYKVLGFKHDSKKELISQESLNDFKNNLNNMLKTNNFYKDGNFKNK